jgi:hypothetical protein
MMDHLTPDLTAELDAAEAIVLDGATVKTEWGVRYDEQGNVGIYGTSSDHERWARMDADGVLVRRTVTYGPWEAVPGA